MKLVALTILALSLWALPTFATNTDLPKGVFELPDGAIALQNIEGKVTDVRISGKTECDPTVFAQDICYESRRIDVQVFYRLGGCMDSLAPITATEGRVQSRRLFINITTPKVLNEKSKTTFCLVEPTSVQTLTVYARTTARFDSVKVVFTK